MVREVTVSHPVTHINTAGRGHYFRSGDRSVSRRAVCRNLATPGRVLLIALGVPAIRWRRLLLLLLRSLP